jgi:hypothetical protein
MKYFTEKELRTAAQEAVRNNFNRQIDLNEIEKFLSAYPDWMKFPVMFELLHNDSEMRCQVALSEKENVWLDITLERWDALPNIPDTILT